MLLEGWGREGSSFSDLNLKIKIRVRGQKATDFRSEKSSCCLLSRDVVLEIWSQGWGQLLPAAVNQCRPTLWFSAIRFSPLWSWTKKKEGGRGSLPEPRTLVKGNYILIPFRNLVYICCQVLPLIVCNAFLCVYLERVYVVFCELRVSNTHTLTDRTVKGCDSPRTLHTLVLLLCKWIILIIVSTLCLSIRFGFFFFSPKWQTLLVVLE